MGKGRLEAFSDGVLAIIITIMVLDLKAPVDVYKRQDWHWEQRDADRAQEFRKCIECFLCQDTCHVLREHDKKTSFAGPRFFARIASLEMHPIDGLDRTELLLSLIHISGNFAGDQPLD